MAYPEIRVIKNNPELNGLAGLIPDVVYSSANGVELKMSIMMPWLGMPENDKKYPLVVFLQGSAWTSPDRNNEIPQLCQLARDGYVVATITHRNCLEGNPFPAFLQDTKTAIRFLRANAEKYHIDPERVAMYGTSSGGNTSLLVGLTGDDERFKTDEYREYSDAVKVVAECFGPTNVRAMVDALPAEAAEEFWGNLFRSLAGSDNIEDVHAVMEKMNPVNYVKDGEKYPPFLILHGDADMLVPYEQSIEIYERLCDAGADVQMIRVPDAPHEGNFWSPELINEIYSFIKERL